jgi:hypothetical protein
VLDAIDKGLAAVEATGLAPNGVAAGLAIQTALRQAYRDVLAMPSEAPGQSVYGLALAVSSTWDASKGDAIVGDWTKLVIGIREDVSFDLSTEGVLLDDADAIVVSAFQTT